MRSLATFVLVTVAAAGCAFVAKPGAQVSVSAGGTFECGSGFHGCTAWLAIRPSGWMPPAGWTPGLVDRNFGPVPSATDRSHWTVSGTGSGPRAPRDRRAPGLAVITEIDDTRPYALGTEDRPGTGALTTTIACQADVQVPAGATKVELTVDFSPCSNRGDRRTLIDCPPRPG